MTTSTQVTEAKKTEITPANVMEIYPLETLTTLKGRKAFEVFSNVELLKPYIKKIHEDSTATVYDFTKSKEYTACGSASKKVSSSRKAIVEAIAASIKTEQDRVNQAKSVKKYVETEMNITRDAVLAPRKAYDEEKAALEQKRIDGIRDRIVNIGAIAILTGTESKEELAGIIDALEAMDVSEGFEEFTQEAMKVKQEAVQVIHNAVNDLVQKEMDEKARIEREREQAEIAAEQKRLKIGERIMNLQQIPMTMFQSTAEEVSDKINSLNANQPTEEDFEDRHGEAMTAFNGVIANLNMLLEQKQQAEEAARIVAEAEKKRLAEEAAAEAAAQQPQPSDTLERLPEEDNAPFMLDEKDEPMFNDCIADAKPEPQEPQPTQFELAQSDLIVLAGITGEQAAQVIKQIQQSNVRGLYANF